MTHRLLVRLVSIPHPLDKVCAAMYLQSQEGNERLKPVAQASCSSTGRAPRQVSWLSLTRYIQALRPPESAEAFTVMLMSILRRFRAKAPEFQRLRRAPDAPRAASQVGSLIPRLVTYPDPRVVTKLLVRPVSTDHGQPDGAKNGLVRRTSSISRVDAVRPKPATFCRSARPSHPQPEPPRPSLVRSERKLH